MRRTAAAALALIALPATAMAEGMPQLDFKNPLTTAQVVWLAIIFAILYQVLARWALPLVAEVLELRAVTIRRDLEAAVAAKAESDAAVVSLTAATKQAQAAAQAEIAAAAAVAKQATAAQTAALAAGLEAQLTEAEQHIAAARAQAMAALRQVATEVAEAMVTRLTGAPTAAATLQQAVDGALAARGLD
jgi:F-type H+-transporting ATPase subunit b